MKNKAFCIYLLKNERPEIKKQIYTLYLLQS